MPDVPTNIEVDTGTGVRDGVAHITYRIREADGRRRLIASFELSGEDAFRVHCGGARVTPATVPDLDRPDRIFDLLDQLTSDTGWVTDRSQEQVLAALRAAFPTVSGVNRILAELAGELDGTHEALRREPGEIVQPEDRIVLPTVNTLWAWEPFNPSAYCLVQVIEVRTGDGGTGTQVRLQPTTGADPSWVPLDQFHERAIPVPNELRSAYRARAGS